MIERFRAAFRNGGAAPDHLGIAVSGGPDSLALLLLANAAFPAAVSAATVDHGLRAQSAEEATFVAQICAELGVPHEILTVHVAQGNLQAKARSARYAALGEWCDRNGITALCTAHHADDQAETLLMRLNRGSGLGGLAGIRQATVIPDHGGKLLRPLLGWRKAELEALVVQAGLKAVVDPSNSDDKFDRARLRSALADSDWLDVEALAVSATNLADAEAALEFAAEREWQENVSGADTATIGYNTRLDTPRELQRRIVARAVMQLAGEPRGGAVMRLVDGLRSGEAGNLGGVLARPKPGRDGAVIWQLEKEPPRQ